MYKLQSSQNLDLSLVWSQYLNPELLAFAVYTLHTELLFIMKSKSQKMGLLLSEFAVTLNTSVTLTECSVQILPESQLWRIKDIYQQILVIMYLVG